MRELACQALDRREVSVLSIEDMMDCAIIGGGPAGLTAAIYLGRFRRKPVVFDDGQSRVLQIPWSRNVPGFPDGVSGPDLSRRMRSQAEPYVRSFVHERVESVDRIKGGFALRSASRTIRARAVVLATGVAVTAPQLDALSLAVARGVIRYCPICDGLETEGKRVAVLAAKGTSVEEAVFLRTYAEDITLLKAAPDCILSDDQRTAAQRHGVRLESRAPKVLTLADDQLHVEFAGGDSERFDVVYPCLGATPRSMLAVAVGAEVTPTGGILVDSRQQTNVPMLYAAGDVLEGLDQIASAWGQAAIAATAIHNRLRKGDDTPAASSAN
jgi:thioredoxin reductase (NADPH)